MVVFKLSVFKKWAVLSALLLLSGYPAFSGQTYRLYSAPGRFAADYDQTVRQLEPGDILEFSNGRAFTIEKVLSGARAGGTTIVLGVGNNRVLRIPLGAGFSPFPMKARRWWDNRTHPARYSYFHDQFLKGYPILVRSGVPVARVYEEESLANEYIVVEKLEIEFTLATLIDHPDLVSEDKRAQALEDLVTWGVSTWKLEQIGDFKPDQLGYTKDGWKLFDWTAASYPAEMISDLRIHFSIPEVDRRVGEGIAEMRQNSRSTCSFDLEKKSQ